MQAAWPRFDVRARGIGLLGVYRNRMLGDNAIYFVGNAAVLVFAYAYHFTSGRLLGPTAYSSVAAIFAIYFVLTVPGLVLVTVAARYSALASASSAMSRTAVLYRRLTLIGGRMSAAMTLLYLGAAPFLATFLHLSLVVVLALTPALSLLLLQSVNRGIFQGQQRFGLLSAVLVTDALGRLVLAIILVAVGLGAPGVIAALGAGLAISYLVSLWPLRTLAKPQTVVDVELRDMFRFAVPTLVAVSGVTFMYNADILLVKHFFASTEAGLYGAAATVGRTVYFATATIAAVLLPRVTRLQEDGRGSLAVLGASVALMGLLAGAFILLFVLWPSVTLLPYGSQFMAAGRYVAPYGAAMAMLSLVNLLVNYLLAVRDTRFVPVLGVAAALEVAFIWRYHAGASHVIVDLFGVLAVTALALSILCLARVRAQRGVAANER